MSMPDSSMISAMSKFLDVRALRSAVAELRPEFGELLRETQDGVPVLALDVNEQNRVVVALVRARVRRDTSVRMWMIDDGRPGSRSSFWPQETGPAVLAGAVVARVDSVVRGRHPSSPWRWDEPAASPITALADALAERGVPVELVVGMNRWITRVVDGVDPEVKHVSESAGQLLHVAATDPAETLEVALRPVLGWTLDRVLPGPAPLDIGRLLTERPGPSPGVKPGDVDIEQLAEAVDRALGTHGSRDSHLFPSTDQTAQIPPVLSRGELDVAATVALWLRWLGYTDAIDMPTQRGAPIVTASGASVGIRTATTPAGLSVVQRLVGVAAVANRQPVLFSASGYTKTAVEWADRAAMVLFSLDLSDGQVWPESVEAKSLFPPRPGRL